MKRSDSAMLAELASKSRAAEKSDRDKLMDSSFNSMIEGMYPTVNFGEDAGNLDGNEIPYIEEDADIRNGYYVPIETDDSIEEIVLDNISDDHGRYSERVAGICEELGTTIVPLSIVNILPEVTSLRDHEIADIGGIKYAYDKNVRTDVVDEYVNEAVEALTCGSYYKRVLNVTLAYRGMQFESLDISPAEIGIIISKLRRYKARLFAKNSGQIFLLVGGAV